MQDFYDATLMVLKKSSTCLPAGAYQNLKFDENEP